MLNGSGNVHDFMKIIVVIDGLKWNLNEMKVGL